MSINSETLRETRVCIQSFCTSSQVSRAEQSPSRFVLKVHGMKGAED